MRPRSAIGVILLGLVASVCLAGPASAGSNDVTVTADRTHVSTQLGRRFEFRTEVVNGASSHTDALVAHLNVLSLGQGVYVDPEDWSARRTVYLGPLGPGESRAITWELQAVNAGSFAVYVVILSQSDPTRPFTPGPVVAVAVVERRTINPGGVLPLALAVPGLVGFLAAGMRLQRRRRTRPPGR